MDHKTSALTDGLRKSTLILRGFAAWTAAARCAGSMQTAVKAGLFRARAAISRERAHGVIKRFVQAAGDGLGALAPARFAAWRGRDGSGDWIGVDLDGTLAYYHGWRGVEHIGQPVPAMLERVKGWIDDGIEVRIFTARICHPRKRRIAIQAIGDWCEQHGLPRLAVTNVKDFQMMALWDDRAVSVETNTGRRTDEAARMPRRRRKKHVSRSKAASAAAPKSPARSKGHGHGDGWERHPS